MVRSYCVLFLVFAFCWTTPALGQLSSDFTLRPTPSTGVPGGFVDTEVRFDNVGTALVEGFSYGVCHDSGFLSLSDATSSPLISGAPFGPADLDSINIFAEGLAHFVVFNLFGGNVDLPPGEDYLFLTVSYEVTGSPGSTDLIVCDGVLGVPPAANVIVVNGQSVEPQTEAATILIENVPDYLLVVDRVEVASSETVTASVTLDVASGVPDANGWSFGVCHGEIVADVVGAAFGPDFTPEAMDFAEITISTGTGVPMGSDAGVSAAVVLAPFPGSGSIPAGTRTVVLEVEYVALGGLDEATELVICDTVVGESGTDVPIQVAAEGSAVLPATEAGSLAIVDFSTPFRRTDCDGDLRLSIGDGIFLLDFLFSDGADPTCMDACDTNDDGRIDLGDPLTLLLLYVMGSGAEIPPPSFSCGTDPTEDALGCEASILCP